MITSESRYDFINRLPSLLLGPRRGRRWRVLAVRRGPLTLDDPRAHQSLREIFRNRPEVEFFYVQACASECGQYCVPEDQDIVFLARPKLYVASPFSHVARLLEARMVGRFNDPDRRLTGDSISYGDRTFSRRALDIHGGLYTRCDRDYAVLVCRTEMVDDHPTLLVAIAGLGSLGTLALAAILERPALRQILTTKAEAFAPLGDMFRPEQAIEICVKITIQQPEGLDSLLNDLERDPDEPPFRFDVVAVAVAHQDGRPRTFFPHRQEEDALVELVLGDPEQRGYLRELGHDLRLKLPTRAWQLLKALARRPYRGTSELCLDLGCIKADGTPHPRKLSKRIHDLNRRVDDKLGIKIHIVQHGTRGYRLVGIRVVRARSAEEETSAQMTQMTQIGG